MCFDVKLLWTQSKIISKKLAFVDIVREFPYSHLEFLSYGFRTGQNEYFAFGSKIDENSSLKCVCINYGFSELSI